MKTKLLLVDDDQVSLLIAKKFLIVSGFMEVVPEISIFKNAGDALELIRVSVEKEELCQFWVLLDINMPKISGWDFLDRVESEELNNHVKVIMLTSSITTEDMNKAASFSSVYGYLSKPLDKQKCAEIKQIMLESGNSPLS